MFLFFGTVFFCCKQKTAYEMRISDWSSDVCSSDLQKRDARSTEHSGGIADCTTSALWALRENLCAVEGIRHQGAAMLHCRLQQHRHVQAGIRLHLRLDRKSVV